MVFLLSMTNVIFYICNAVLLLITAIDCFTCTSKTYIPVCYKWEVYQAHYCYLYVSLALPFLCTRQKMPVQHSRCEQSSSVRRTPWRSECQRSEKRMATPPMGGASETTFGQTAVRCHVTAQMVPREVGGDTSWDGKGHTTIIIYQVSP